MRVLLGWCWLLLVWRRQVMVADAGATIDGEHGVVAAEVWRGSSRVVVWVVDRDSFGFGLESWLLCRGLGGSSEVATRLGFRKAVVVHRRSVSGETGEQTSRSNLKVAGFRMSRVLMSTLLF